MDTTGHFAKAFAKNGFVCAGFDMRGHGKSEGEDTESFKVIMEDSKLFISKTEETLRALFQGKDQKFLDNKFIWGMSMGGMMSIEMSRLDSSIKGAMLLCPAVTLGEDDLEKQAIIDLGKKSPESVFASTNDKSPCNNSNLWEDKESFIYQRSTKLRSGSAIAEHSIIAEKYLSEYETKFVIVIPGLDRTVPAIQQFAFFDNSKSKDKEVWLYENNRHAIIWEKEVYEIIDRLIVW
eukprot:CAMPEP_0170518428 /NCGR_PEP_ID=MMETSP0209-20121228/4117_1 /TAXON_ID=665100 ORGANISM="Litonotus pictus, Strain P1" /NCGR_SAMPLE_ID=MMETSP0209 /ASSEMBLY_ACC=CAM_ASM_000301 /LENGTH=235 /DNA_ID=CAMNT_0010803983 /DNA_START=253 /DNA_END=957 /DNA_ORIENTATION=-